MKEFKNWWLNNNKPGIKKSYELYNKNEHRLSNRNIRKYIKELKSNEPFNIIDLLGFLKFERTILEIQDRYDFTECEAWKHINDLKKAYNITEINGWIKLEKNINVSSREFNYDWDGQEIIRFGVVADTHLCNKCQQLSFLNELYDLFELEEIPTVYHAGDLSDGYYKNRPGHIYELIPGKIGADEQADYIKTVYPKRSGITTEIVDGNHDWTHIQNGGADLVKRICRERDDFKYLGQGNAIINLTPGCKIELNHPTDGTAYALSYSLQKYIDSMSGGQKPNILINGHHHKAMYLFYRNIHAIEAGTICAQTPWMRSKRLAAHVGGWIVTVHLDCNGSIRRFMPELIPLYNIKEGDY